MQNNTINGRFYLKKTRNGNLVGEFSNDHDTKISTESCDAQGYFDGNYIGKYNSTWQEKGTPLFAELEIVPNTSNEQLFVLEWRRNGKPIFKGAGMLCDDILIGDYQSV